MTDLPLELEAEHQQTLATERQALLKLQQQEQLRQDHLRRLDDSLRSLAGNADFEYWLSVYLAGDVALKLDQLATCPVADLPLARQRWLDARSQLEDIQQAVRDVTAK